MIKETMGMPGGPKNPEQEKLDRKKEIEKVAVNLGAGYADEIVDDGKSPESYIFNGRRVLRSAMQVMLHNIEKAGIATKKSHGAKALKCSDICEIETSDPKYRDFIDALNIVAKEYDKLYDGSEKIYSERKRDKK